MREKRKAREEKYRSLVEAGDAIFWMYNMETDHWDYVLLQSEESLGHHPEEWTDLAFWTARLHTDDRAWAYEYLHGCNL